ncbi:hypothetical protein [Methylocapsa sp. S129]|uniref:hypothetical protein n=1 Tax=Methylocapsa sp. S129 TaxID=1641869 RepID=UPI00131A6777|nr:hypothetical protein [Methylocapsa sp. S129]
MRGGNEWRYRLGALLLVARALLFVSPTAPAWAHHEGSAQAAPTDGISIPSLSHGQMAVIADNRAAILDLAAQQTPTDPVMRRLESFVNLQYFACMWGLAPGSLDDENSPFNECSHAYLAATRALLVHLQDMTGDRTAVRALVAKIELEMLSNGASLVLCRYSDEPFNIAEVISPHWRDIPSHPPSLMTFAGLAMAMLGCAWLGVRRKLWPG